MKKRLVVRLSFLLVVMVLITATLVSGTFAKYTSSVYGSDTTRVAKFDFDVTDGTNAIDRTDSSATTLDLFSLADGESGVYTNNGTVIAPGTTGNFTIEVTNKSEVKVKAVVKLTEVNDDDVPIYYVYGGQRYSEKLSGSYTDGGTTGIYQTIDQLAAAVGTMDVDGGANVTKSVEITWAWDFEVDPLSLGQTDTSDTELGTAETAPKVTLDVEITVTQVDD